MLPPAPATFGEPVDIPAPRVGQDARIYAAQVVAAMRRANIRLADDRAFYEAVTADFGAPRDTQ